MSLFKKIVLFSSTLFLLSCSSDESPNDPVAELYFTFNANSDTSESDNWIIIHNENGELLDYKAFEENDFLKFETLNPLLTDKISISFFTYIESNGNTSQGINTTTGVDKGSVWDIEFEPFIGRTTNTSIGDFNFTLTNFPEIDLLNISNENGLISGGLSGSGSGGIWTYSASNYNLYEKNDYLFTLTEPILDSKYYFLENIQNKDDISINYSEFKLFDSYLSIDIPQNTPYLIILSGFEDSQDYSITGGFGLSQIFPSYSVDLNQYPVRVGYLDRFNKYRTQFSAYFDEYTFNYLKNGTEPSEINVPENLTFNINDTSIQNFEFSTDVSFMDYSSLWTNNTGTFNIDFIGSSWRVKSTDNMYHKIGDLPNEIITSYPELDVSALNYSNTVFTLNSEENIIFK